MLTLTGAIDGGSDVAGESAHELARRQREKAERLLKSAERYEQGARGEEATGAILDTLRYAGWAVFHDVRWPGRQRANIDHVVVGPPGVFVIDAKNWTGSVDVRDQSLWHNGRRRDKTVAAAGDAALTVASHVGPEACAATRSVLCFVRDEPLTGWCYDVMVCSTANLRELLLTRPAVLTPDQARTAGVELDRAFRAAARTHQAPSASARPRSLPAFRSPAPSAPRSRSTRRGRRKSSGGGQLLRLGLVVLTAFALIHLMPHLGKLGDGLGQHLVAPLTPPATRTYADCAALRAVYPHGVGTRAAVRRVDLGGRAPAAEPVVYRANQALDLDHDGLACEPRANRHR